MYSMELFLKINDVHSETNRYTGVQGSSLTVSLTAPLLLTSLPSFTALEFFTI